MEVNAALMQDSLRQVNEVVAREIAKMKTMFATKQAFDKFSVGTVDALEQTKENIKQQESLTDDLIRKYKKCHLLME